MKIGVFGTGVVGQTIAEKLAGLGHDVMMGTREVKAALARTEKDNFGRPPLKDWHAGHANIKLGTYTQAAAHGELLVNATNGMGTLDALKQASEANVNGKVLLDLSNPLDFSKGMPPSFFVTNTDSLGEQVQRAYPKVKVVKTLNTMNAYLMVSPRMLPASTTVFLSGNDAGAKDAAKGILRSFGWKDADMIDLGDITTARGAEMYVALWVRLWGGLQNPMFNLKVVVGQAPAM